MRGNKLFCKKIWHVTPWPLNDDTLPCRLQRIYVGQSSLGEKLHAFKIEKSLVFLRNELFTPKVCLHYVSKVLIRRSRAVKRKDVDLSLVKFSFKSVYQVIPLSEEVAM